MAQSFLLRNLIEAVEKDLLALMKATEAAHKAAIDSENTPENKYDTQSLEASYIAQGQANRAQELRKSLHSIKAMPLEDFQPNAVIKLSASLTLETEEGEIRHFFIAIAGAGRKIEYKDKQYTVITPSSPLGASLMGKMVGDIITVSIHNLETEYEILNIE